MLYFTTHVKKKYCTAMCYGNGTCAHYIKQEFEEKKKTKSDTQIKNKRGDGNDSEWLP